MHPERVIIVRVSAVVAVVVVVVIVAIAVAVGAFGSLLVGHLFWRPPTSSGNDHRNSRYSHSL
jgi:hypothetical protein